MQGATSYDWHLLGQGQGKSGISLCLTEAQCFSMALLFTVGPSWKVSTMLCSNFQKAMIPPQKNWFFPTANLVWVAGGVPAPALKKMIFRLNGHMPVLNKLQPFQRKWLATCPQQIATIPMLKKLTFRLSGWPHACPQQIATVPALKKLTFRLSGWPHACPQQIATVPALKKLFFRLSGWPHVLNKLPPFQRKKNDVPSEWLATCLSSTNCHRSSAKKNDVPSEWLATCLSSTNCHRSSAKKKWFPRPSLSTRQGFTSWCFGCGYWHLFNHGKFRGNLSLGTKTLHKNLSKGSTPGVYHASRQGSGNHDCPYLPSQSKSCNSGKKERIPDSSV